MARPKKEINYNVAEGLAGLMCTEEEIASVLDVSVRTLQRDDEFCRIFKKGKENGKMSLRRKQFKLADTSASMAIWLGKQYLGQTDKIVSALDINNTPQLDINIIDNTELEKVMYEDNDKV